MIPNNVPTTFTSYAQNFEDVMLWRALKHVSAGVYVDVGAQHPVEDSVSKAFYEHGWRGVHVEPVPYYAELLGKDRPDEVILQLAFAEEAGTLEMHTIPGTGLSTAVKANAERLAAQYSFDNQTIRVPALPMRTALEFLVGQQVHWLKIDVEGFEENVLRGWDSKILRPWIILVEATVPMSIEQHWEGADRILLDADYRFVYFDGLNRFYVAAEHPELIPAFEAPPNVFDGAQLSGQSSSSWCAGLVARHRAQQQVDAEEVAVVRAELTAAQRSVEAELERQRSRAIRAEAHAATAEKLAAQAMERAVQAEARALAVRDPALRRLANAVAEGRVTSGIKRRLKVALRVATLAIQRHPRLKRVVLLALGCVPPLKRRLQAMTGSPPSTVARAASSNNTRSRMSPDTTVIYGQLRRRRQSEGQD